VDAAPKASVCFLGGTREIFGGPFRRFVGRNRKSRRREAAGRRNYPEAVPNEAGRKGEKVPERVLSATTNEEAWLVRVLINICRDQSRKASIRYRYNKARFEGSHLASGIRDPEAGPNEVVVLVEGGSDK